jgi:3'-phosphoadenosine 5'-phosphosulfate sulfotransferase (PAPS reductase)/FAD synthetase
MNTEHNSLIEGMISTALSEIDAAIREHNPMMVVGLFSGGNDSLACCHVASLHSRFSGILHVNTGIGIEDTRTFVRNTCKERGWKLWEYKAAENTFSTGEPDPMIYEDLVLKYGFPGPGQHQSMYIKLKERQLMRFERDMGASGRGKEKKRIMFVTGVRIDEPKRRKMNVGVDLVDRIEPRRIFISPIRHWSKAHCKMLRDWQGLTENEVSKNIHKSGECLCGAFAKPDELAELKFFYPKEAAHIERIQERAKAAGKHCVWGVRPPKKSQINSIASMPLCTSCVLSTLQTNENPSITIKG